jgi:hypothetical protein
MESLNENPFCFTDDVCNILCINVIKESVQRFNRLCKFNKFGRKTFTVKTNNGDYYYYFVMISDQQDRLIKSIIHDVRLFDMGVYVRYDNQNLYIPPTIINNVKIKNNIIEDCDIDTLPDFLYYEINRNISRIQNDVDLTNFIGITRCSKIRDTIYRYLKVDDLLNIRLACRDTTNSIFENLDKTMLDEFYQGLLMNDELFDDNDYLKFILKSKMTLLTLSSNTLIYKDELMYIRGIDAEESAYNDDTKIFSFIGDCKYPNMDYLNINRCTIDMRGIENMKTITCLNLWVTKIENIECLSQLINLNHIDLEGEFDQDINFLADLPSLTSLRLPENYSHDLNKLPSKLESLEHDHGGGDVNIVKFSINAKLPISLKTLTIRPHRYMGKLIGLEECCNLKYLRVSNGIDLPQLPSNIAYLECCYISDDTLPSHITYDKLYHIELLKIKTDLSKFSNLKDLQIHGNKSISCDLRLKSLTKLRLYHNFNQPIHFLEDCEKLEELWIYNKSFDQDMSSLKYLINLKKLEYEGNDIRLFYYIPKNCTTIILGNYEGNFRPFITRIDHNKNYEIHIQNKNYRKQINKYHDVPLPPNVRVLLNIY